MRPSVLRTLLAGGRGPWWKRAWYWLIDAQDVELTDMYCRQRPDHQWR